MRNWTRRRYAAMAVLSAIVLLGAAAIQGFSTTPEPVRVLLFALSGLGMVGVFGFTGAAAHAARAGRRE